MNHQRQWKQLDLHWGYSFYGEKEIRNEKNKYKYTVDSRIAIKSQCSTYKYIYTRSLDLRVRPSATPPHSHTSDRPIFKIPFDSENSGKLTRFRIGTLMIKG